MAREIIKIENTKSEIVNISTDEIVRVPETKIEYHEIGIVGQQGPQGIQGPQGPQGESANNFIGGDGISVVESPSDVWTVSVSGDYATSGIVETVSGDLQSQINSNDNDIVALQNYDSQVADVTGDLQSQINSNDNDIVALQNYDSQVADVTGNLQSQINSIDVVGGSDISVTESPDDTFTINLDDSISVDDVTIGTMRLSDISPSLIITSSVSGISDLKFASLSGMHGKIRTSIGSFFFQDNTDTTMASLDDSALSLASGVDLYMSNGTKAKIDTIEAPTGASDIVTINDSLTVTDDLTVNGDTYLNGDVFSVSTEHVSASDNLITINAGEVGPGVTAGKAGIEVDRGSATNYEFVFDETTDTFRVGEVGSTQAVATREDTPVDNRIPYWDAASNSFKTDADVEINVDGIVAKETLQGRRLKTVGTSSMDIAWVECQNDDFDSSYFFTYSTFGPNVGNAAIRTGAGKEIMFEIELEDIARVTTDGIRMRSGKTITNAGGTVVIDDNADINGYLAVVGDIVIAGGLTLSGDTITADGSTVTIDDRLVVTGSGVFAQYLGLDSPDNASEAKIFLRTDGTDRWCVSKTEAEEFGSNVGSNFSICRYSDAGGYIDSPLTISRDTGNVLLADVLDLNDHMNFKNYNDGIFWNDAFTNGMWFPSAGNFSLRVGLLTPFIDATSSEINVHGNASVDGILTVGEGSGVAQAVIDGDASGARTVVVQTGGVARWAFGGGATAEFGSDAGTPWKLWAYDDSGAQIDVPINIDRAADGLIRFNRPTRINDDLTVTGDVNLAGGLTLSGDTINANGSEITVDDNLTVTGGLIVGDQSNLNFQSASSNLYITNRDGSNIYFRTDGTATRATIDSSSLTLASGIDLKMTGRSLLQVSDTTKTTLCGSTVADASASRINIYGKSHTSVPNEIWAFGDTYFRSISGGSRVSITGTKLSIEQTTASTSTSTGALTVAGGVGIAGSMNVGGNASVDGDLELSSSSFTYYGDPSTDGTWRQGRSGDDFVTQRRESGSWVTKQTISA